MRSKTYLFSLIFFQRSLCYPAFMLQHPTRGLPTRSASSFTIIAQQQHPLIILRAKQKNRKNKHNRSNIREDNVVGDTNNNPLTSAAANRPMATLAGVTEDHNYEQFFYGKTSTQSIYQKVKSYSHPLLLCNPSLAVMAEEDNIQYLLLDRDKRFSFLKHYKEFSLMKPFLISRSYPYNALFIDPPFANVTPSQLVRCIRLMGTNESLEGVPIYIAYNSKREDALLAAFGELPCPPLTRLWNLDYRSVRGDMQDNIFLYGPSVL
jgi:16S rRNA G966 N2-methylase RsmD